jgi:hypothetical protein
MRSIYCVPTHRRVAGENLRGFLAELDVGQIHSRQAIPFCFFDDLGGDQHRQLLRHELAPYPAVQAYIFDQEACNRLVARLAGDVPREHAGALAQLRLEPDVSYGKVMNKLFLMALLFGVEALHRRDMDTLPPLHATTGEVRYPIELELEWLGPGRSYAVGGGYQGASNLDLSALGAAQNEKVHRILLSLLSFRPEHHDAIIERQAAAARPFREDRVTHGEDAFPECGNYSLYRLFEFLPCSAARETLGTDYFPTVVALELGWPVSYHSRAVLHRHTACRYDSLHKTLAYWRGLARMLDANVMYHGAAEGLPRGGPAPDPSADLSIELARMLRAHHPRFLLERRARKDRIVQLVELIASAPFTAAAEVARTLTEQLEMILDETDSAVLRHAELMEAWPAIVEAAQGASGCSWVQREFQHCRVVPETRSAWAAVPATDEQQR